MSCITKYYCNEYTVLGVWKIEEDIDTLLKMVSLDKYDKRRYSKFSSTSRRIEFLSVRALLAEVIGKNAHIVYNKNNKPFLRDGSRFISITHSHNLTAILCSSNERVGIDLEYMRKNIGDIAYKFINSKERITNDPEMRRYHLYIHWCAKEALYKICDKEDIDFKTNLTIDSFDIDSSFVGSIKGSVKTKKINESFDLNYFKYENYTIVWTKKRL